MDYDKLFYEFAPKETPTVLFNGYWFVRMSIKKLGARYYKYTKNEISMMKETVINYHVKCPGLDDALRAACDLYQSGGLMPDSIDFGPSVVRFDYRDARAVIDGRMPLSRYEFIHAMEVSFRGWVDAFFHPLVDRHLDAYLVLDEVLADYRQMTGDGRMTRFRLLRRIAEWAEDCAYIDAVNPYDLCTTKPGGVKQVGRILRRRRDADGEPTGSPVDHIYLRTIPDVYAREKERYAAMERMIDDDLKEEGCYGKV